jgi:hypothetical protein
MRLLATVAVLAALGVAASPAAATTGSFEVPRLPGSTLPQDALGVLAGPVPAGDAVAFATGNAGRGWAVQLGAPGARVRDVAAVAPRAGLTFVLHASATRLALARHAQVCVSCKYMLYDVTLDDVLAGPLAGPLATVADCDPRTCSASTLPCAGSGSALDAALGGDLLAFRGGCSATATLVDLATGASRPLPPAQALAVAGPFVALAESSQTPVVVVDAASGAEVYRTAAPAAAGFPLAFGGSAEQLALRADGTVVFVSVVERRPVLVAASPAEPAGRVLREVPAATAILGAGPAGVLLHDRRQSRLELVGLDGAARPLRTLPDLAGTPAFDGSTIAWAQRNCVTTAITSWRLGDPPPAAPDLRCPTPRPVRVPVTLPRNRMLSVGLSCPATARGGCLANAELVALRRAAGRGAARSYRLGGVRVALDPGERGRAQLLVPPAAARRVRRHAPLRLRIDVTNEQARAARRPARDDGTVTWTVPLRAAR